MDNIRIEEKPDWMSWDDVHELLAEAHQSNFKKGIILKYALMPGEQIRKKLGEEGCCWIAFDGDKPVGSISNGRVPI